MKLAIVDANYNKVRYRGLAATWLAWEMERAEQHEYPPELADVLLCTVSSQQGVADLRRELRRINNPRARVVLGGGGCYAPAVFDGLMDVACVGEGARFVRTLLRDGLDAAMALPEAWVPGETREVVPYDGFPWELPPLNHPDGTVRIFGSRGCRYGCLFCQTAWEASYRLHPSPERLQRQADALVRERRRVALITNDGAEAGVHVPCQQEFLSVRMDNLLQQMPLARSVTKSVRIGVEGISERLRRAVGKPVGNEDLLRVSCDLLAAGVGVRWFFIPGLPGEAEADYDELRSLVREVKRFPKGAVMANFHAFIPQPATPLAVLPLADAYWDPFDEFRRWFFHGPGFTRRLQIVAPARYAGRLRRAQESMAATEAELRRGWWEHANANWRIRYRVSVADRRRMARRYAARVGLVPRLVE